MVSTPVAAASTVGPKIFQIYPHPGLPLEGDHFYYDRAVNISYCNFLAFLLYAMHYDLPLLIHACPDLAAFHVSHPLANIQLFTKASSRIISRGHKHLALDPLGTQGVPVVPLGTCSTSGSSHRSPFFCVFLTPPCPTAGILCPSWADPVPPSLYWPSHRVFPPQLGLFPCQIALPWPQQHQGSFPLWGASSEVALCPLLPWYCVKSSWNIWFRDYQHVFYLEKVHFHLGKDYFNLISPSI